MHPVLAKKTWLAWYLLAWTFLSVLLAALLRMPGTLSRRDAMSVSIPLCLLYAFVCLTPWYVGRYTAQRDHFSPKLLLNHLGSALLASAMWVQLARFYARMFHFSEQLSPDVPLLAGVGMLLYLLSVALHYMMFALQASRESAVQARDAELRALKAQINPHFLFNSLNSIAALTAVDPSKAREMCIRLSDFLRNTLGLGERESISWREELQLARTYLDVEQVRFGSRLKVEMNVDEDCGDCQVPPLVLQPLIENAVKHGIATMVEGGTIKLEVHIKGQQLEVSVENGFDPDSPSPRRNGLGLRNVRSRLENRFGSLASLSAQSQNNQFRAEMIVPCQRPE